MTSETQATRMFAAIRRIKLKPAQNAAVATMFGEHLTAIVELLGKRHWTVLTAPAGGPHFIASDNPLTLHWISSADKGGYSPGFGLRGTSVQFPVSSQRIIGRPQAG